MGWGSWRAFSETIITNKAQTVGDAEHTHGAHRRVQAQIVQTSSHPPLSRIADNSIKVHEISAAPWHAVALTRRRCRRNALTAKIKHTGADVLLPNRAYLLRGDDLADQVEADHDQVDAEVEGAPHVQRLL